jgi:hypothetical protein
VTLALEVVRAGKYTLHVHFTRARDYGIVQVSLDGRKLGQPFDGYHSPEVVPSGPVALGTVELPAGAHTLRFEVVGANPDSTKEEGRGYFLGIDCLSLTPAE